MQTIPNYKKYRLIAGQPKIPATQNIAKNRKDFPMHEQSISNSKTEAIT